MNGLRQFISAQVAPGWSTKPFWALFRRVKQTGYPEEELLSVYRDYGVIPKASREDNFNKESEDLSNYQLVEKGFLVTNKMKAWQGSIAISRYRGVVSPAYYVYKPLGGAYDQFLHYLLRSSPYVGLYGRISKGVRVNQWDLEHEALRNIPILLPDPLTQKRIADFLDRETARIDQLIEKKLRLVEVLVQKRAAILSCAVTRGVDPNGALKPSGLAWVGHAPEHWTTWKVGHFARIGNGSTPERENPAYWDGGTYPWLNSSSVNRSPISYADQFVTERALKECHLPRVQPGSVLVALTGQGKTRGTAAVLDFEATINQHIAYVTPSRKVVTADYLQLVFGAAYGELRRISDDLGSTKGALTCSDISNFKVPLPPLAEQEQIVLAVRQKTKQVDATIALIEQSIQRLGEYRSALITAAVTGEIDVDTWRKRGDTNRRLEAIAKEASV